jgi:hypothetical protein
VLVLVVAACGDRGGGEAGEATSEASDSSTPTTGDPTGGAGPGPALCEHVFSCGCTPGYLTVEGCVTSYDFNIQLYMGLAAQWGLEYDGSCLESYAQEVIAGGCATPDELQETCSSCSSVHGSVAEGQPCTQYNDEISDCAQGLECEGICYDPCEAYGPGEVCGNDDQGTFATCQPGLYCDYATHLCEALPLPGEPCNTGDGCVSGHFCDDQTDPMNPVCAPRRAAGEPCTNDECADGLVCGQTDSVCREPPGPGEPCNYSACADGNWCDYDDMTCKARAPAGTPCESDESCVENTICSQQGTCAPQVAWFCMQP